MLNNFSNNSFVLTLYFVSKGNQYKCDNINKTVNVSTNGTLGENLLFRLIYF